MIQVPATATILIMHEAVSFRNGFQGLTAIARTLLQKDPMDGTVFVFRNKGKQMLRLLFYDGQGFWLATKRLSRGTFSTWPKGDGHARCAPLLARELQVLIWGGDPVHCAFPQLWKKVA